MKRYLTSPSTSTPIYYTAAFETSFWGNVKILATEKKKMTMERKDCLCSSSVGWRSKYKIVSFNFSAPQTYIFFHGKQAFKSTIGTRCYLNPW